MRMDPICGEQLDALNAADCALGKTNRSQGRPPEYSSVPALQAMGPTWRLQIPLDLFVAPGVGDPSALFGRLPCMERLCVVMASRVEEIGALTRRECI